MTLRLGTRVTGVSAADDGFALTVAPGAEPVRCRFAVNAAGLASDDVDRMFGADGFTIKPRKGELIVFDKLARPLLSSIILPVPTARTKGCWSRPPCSATSCSDRPPKTSRTAPTPRPAIEAPVSGGGRRVQ